MLQNFPVQLIQRVLNQYADVRSDVLKSNLIGRHLHPVNFHFSLTASPEQMSWSLRSLFVTVPFD